LSNLNKQSNKWKNGVITFYVIWGFILFWITVSNPEFWPAKSGFAEDKSVTTTVEKDPQGKITKTVETTKTDPDKTLWDWLSLLGVPFTLAVFGFFLQQIQQERSEKSAIEQRKRDKLIADKQRELAANETKEEVLQGYFDRLSTLLIDKNLMAIAAKVYPKELQKSEATPEEKELVASAVDVVRARTLSILRRFENDRERKTSVIRFLIETDFIRKLSLDLSNADLSAAILRYADLSGAILANANLIGADLRYADLSGAILVGADLRYADLANANLSGADLRYADLSGANLSGANLANANLANANLSGADLSGANLRRANLANANLSGAILGFADLSGADLRRADLIGANLAIADLSGADLSGANLRRAILVDADLIGANLANANLSGIKNFSREQLQLAKNWEAALYDKKRLDDPEVMAQLGLNA
jgi:uncharacterized protein YjbI with pentapeptide repeats